MEGRKDTGAQADDGSQNFSQDWEEYRTGIPSFAEMTLMMETDTEVPPAAKKNQSRTRHVEGHG